jgi:hypothetical protein
LKSGRRSLLSSGRSSESTSGAVSAQAKPTCKLQMIPAKERSVVQNASSSLRSSAIRSSTRRTRNSPSEVSTSMAGDSRVHSSTMVNSRITFPPFSASETCTRPCADWVCSPRGPLMWAKRGPPGVWEMCTKVCAVCVLFSPHCMRAVAGTFSLAFPTPYLTGTGLTVPK